MITVKVKTLDSKNHDFEVDEELTVRLFKEHIAEKCAVAADQQRLIYCGRVLTDEKQLKEYDVNGKVVHLVQRPPPSSNRPTSTTESRRDTPRRIFRAANADPFQIENLLEGMLVDGRVMSIPSQTTLSPSSTLCQNRITVARHMLNCADNIAAYLEDPERGLNNAAMDILAQQTMESTVFEVGISAVGDIDIPQQQVQNLMQAFQGAVSATFRQNGIQNITVQQNPDGSAASVPTIQVFGTIPHEPEANGGSNVGASTTETPPEAQPSPPSAPTTRSQQTTSTTVLAEVVQQMRNVQQRLDPFIHQYHEILQNDPNFEADERVNNQRVFDRVSEALHYMSHAQHAISDLMLDLSLERPRHLTCRPILVEQSAFVSSGLVPGINVVRSQPNNNNTGEITATTATINIPIPIPFPFPMDSRTGQQPPESGTLPGQPPVHVARLIQAALNAAAASSMTRGATAATGTVTMSNSGAQGESNTGAQTQPTTSTQTRSTSRPTVAPAGMRGMRPIPANMLSSFDRFLPCNSHHVIVPENTQQQQQQQQQTRQGTNQATQRGRQSPDEAMQNLTHEEYSTPVHLFGSHLTLRDFINVAPTATTLNRIRGEVQEFIRISLFNGQPISEDTTGAAVDRAISSIRHYFHVLQQYERPDYDARASVEQLLRAGLPPIIALVEEDASEEFGIRVLREILTFTRRLLLVLVTTIGQQNAWTYLNRVVNMTIPFFDGPLRVFQRYIQHAIGNALSALTMDTEDVQQFLVIRRPASAPAATTTAPTPMETDEASGDSETSRDYERLRDSLETPPLAQGSQTLPTVTQGSEPWHSQFPTEWLPVITHDIEVQRSDKRAQEPFSDAYISSMSAKRRKTLNSSKTPTEPNKLLTSCVKRAAEKATASTSGTGRRTAPEEVSVTISAENVVQQSFREHLRQTIRNRVANDPNFIPERFPNVSKQITKP